MIIKKLNMVCVFFFFVEVFILVFNVDILFCDYFSIFLNSDVVNVLIFLMKLIVINVFIFFNFVFFG